MSFCSGKNDVEVGGFGLHLKQNALARSLMELRERLELFPFGFGGHAVDVRVPLSSRGPNATPKLPHHLQENALPYRQEIECNRRLAKS